MYEYQTPEGYGDIFFVYNVNGEDIPITNGTSPALLGVNVTDGDFVCRVWSGGALLVNITTGTVQMYDGVRRAWFQLPALQTNFPSGMAVLPEKVYRNNTALRFDLTNVALKVNTNGANSVFADQMAWFGSRRILHGPNDPAPSQYPYYEKPYSYPVAVSITNNGPSLAGAAVAGLAAPIQNTIKIFDYDFELRRITMNASGAGTRASLFLATGEVAEFILTAVAPGAAGNLININLVATAPNQVFGIAVVGNAITVTLQTDGLGNPLTTGLAFQAAYNATPAAVALATITVLFNPLILLDSGGAHFLVGGGGGGGGVSAYASPFKIMLFDAEWRQRSVVPILAELLCHNASTGPPTSAAPNNGWPSPPIMYPINSVIRFDIYSLIPTGDTLPVTVNLLFEGVRRIRCS